MDRAKARSLIAADETPRFAWSVRDANDDDAPGDTIEQRMGYRLTLAIDAAGFTIDQLAAATKIAPINLLAYEAGTARIPPADLITLCMTLECKFHELLPPSDQPSL